MKKLLLGLLLINSFIYAQNRGDRYCYFSGGIDVRNAIVGSDPTNNQPALDIPLYFGVVGEKGWGGSIGVEFFPKIDYFSWSLKASKEFYILNDKVSLIPSFEYVNIHRWYDVSYDVDIPEYNFHKTVNAREHYNYNTFGANLDVNYNFNELHSIGLRLNTLKRSDLEDKYPEVYDFIILNEKFNMVNSIYLTYTFKIPLPKYY